MRNKDKILKQFYEKLKLFIDVSDSKENEHNVDVTGWVLTSYV